MLLDLPTTYTQQYDGQEWGVFLYVVQPIIKRKIFGWKKASLNLAVRFDYVDWNVGSLKETGSNIGENVLGITPVISFRPSAQNVFRLNYRYQWQKGVLSNLAAQKASWLFGFSSYF